MLLVVGGTGTVGSEVIRQLREQGHETRALVRSEEKAEQVRAGGAEAVIGDLADTRTLAPALDGVERAFVVLPSTPDQVDLEGNLIEAVAANDGTSLVRLSVVGADPESPLRFSANHGKADRALADSGVEHTLLQPNDFMQNSFAWAGSIRAEGKVYTPNADAQIASVDARDIAASAVAALTENGHLGKVHVLSGPEALTRREQVGRVGDAIGREIEVVAVSNEQARAAMLEAGYPEYAVGGLFELFENVYDPGYAAAVSRGVEDATGRPPRSWEQFARDHAQTWS